MYSSPINLTNPTGNDAEKRGEINRQLPMYTPQQRAIANKSTRVRDCQRDTVLPRSRWRPNTPPSQMGCSRFGGLTLILWTTIAPARLFPRTAILLSSGLELLDRPWHITFWIRLSLVPGHLLSLFWRRERLAPGPPGGMVSYPFKPFSTFYYANLALRKGDTLSLTYTTR